MLSIEAFGFDIDFSIIWKPSGALRDNSRSSVVLGFCIQFQELGKTFKCH
jgi:hypothetical protein